MRDRWKRLGILIAGVAALGLVPASNAGATSPIRVSSDVAPTLSSTMPIVRLHFSAVVNASQLPHLVIRPALSTKWQQIGPRAVQAVATSRLKPQTRYVIETPATMLCSSACHFETVRSLSTNIATNVAWEEQLLAETGYLPLSFTPSVPGSDPGVQESGTFTWLYPQLPVTLSSQWQVGVDNVLVTGALMAFQNDHQLPTTGVADPTTWNDLVNAAETGQVDPNSYNYVSVTETQPETLTLYVAGVPTFHTLVNTGISVAPTALGTFPVYLRFTSQTMSGTNPDGTHYSDPGIPWISYFNGGDALHGFIRYSYGWPQSLGCVEMPFASAKTVWPYTPIGTLVTILG
ncbi:MAG: L,D-transpeptidase family protein [Acidimicrobiales bacterium]